MITSERIEILVNKYGNMILRLSYTYLKNIADAEDVVQDVFLKIVEKMPEVDDEAYEKAWIIRVTINICKNKLKMFWNKNVDLVDEMKEIASFDEDNDNSDVFKAVMSLSEKYRTVIHLYYYEGYSTPEIANLIDKNEVTVRSLLHRAREKLKSVLKEAYDFE